MRRDAVGQVEESAEEVEFGVAEAFDIRPAVGIAQGGANSEDDDVQQGMPFGAVQAGIGQVCKEWCKKFQSVVGWHPSPPRSNFHLRSIVRNPLDEVNCTAE